MLERKIFKNLENWKYSPKRKPLILQGARQVGKSFAVMEFGKKHFHKVHKINFQSNKKAWGIFEGNLEVTDLIKKIEYLLDDPIDTLRDLVFFDEIQECHNALNSLKFFCEELPELAIIGAGSYLGIMKNESAFPVGKVDFLSMFPLNFEEFLQSLNPRLFDFYRKLDLHAKIEDYLHTDLTEVLFFYLAIGGMPEIVQNYKDLYLSQGQVEALKQTRKLQKNLIESYKSDFSKHAGLMNSSHILQVYESVPHQLSLSFDEESDKFKFSGVIPNQKGFERIIGPLTWLGKSRLIIKNFIISNIELPLQANKIHNKFKVFLHDIGLLNAILETPITSIVNSNANIGSYKGYIMENFVATELFCIFDNDLHSFEKLQSEIEFIVQKENYIIPLEVKSSAKSKKAKSLDSYVKRYAPEYAYKLSLQNYGYTKEKGYATIPLYLVGRLFE